jgi:putative PIN family toxin of toxin-antitoxin system
MIKVVLDTNVVVSAYLVPGGKPAQILSLAKAGEISIFLSPQIIEEIRETLLRPKLTKIHKATPKEIDQFIIDFEKATTITQGAKRVYAVNSDPDDNKILAAPWKAKRIISFPETTI